MKTCWNCYTTYGLEAHHSFGGPNRKISDKMGWIVYLCADCHRGQPNGVHGGNEVLSLQIKQHFQSEFEKTGTREQFIKLIGRNYL